MINAPSILITRNEPIAQAPRTVPKTTGTNPFLWCSRMRPEFRNEAIDPPDHISHLHGTNPFPGPQHHTRGTNPMTLASAGNGTNPCSAQSQHLPNSRNEAIDHCILTCRWQRNEATALAPHSRTPSHQQERTHSHSSSAATDKDEPNGSSTRIGDRSQSPTCPYLPNTTERSHASPLITRNKGTNPIDTTSHPRQHRTKPRAQPPDSMNEPIPLAHLLHLPCTKERTQWPHHPHPTCVERSHHHDRRNLYTPLMLIPQEQSHSPRAL